MPNTGGYFSETLSNATTNNNNNNNSSKTLSITNKTPPKMNNNPLNDNDTGMEVDEEDLATNMVPDTESNDIDENDNEENVNKELDDDDDNEDHFDERLVVDYEGNLEQVVNDEDALVNELILPYSDEVLSVNMCLEPQDVNNHASTPKSSKTFTKQLSHLLNKEPKTDGKVITNEITNDFQQNSNISPIYGGNPSSPAVNQEKLFNTTSVNADSCCPLEMFTAGLDNEAELDVDDGQSELKRKRESFDSISLMSMESFVLPTSTKKPKLLRTGSITRTLKRSMSFVAVRTPIAKMLRPRRSSVALDTAPIDGNNETNNGNADDSICSIASVDTTFNESIRKPVKEKILSLRNRITRSSSRKEKCVISAQQKSPEKDLLDYPNEHEDFKTPKAPAKYGSGYCSSAPRPVIRSSSTSTSTSKLCNKSLNFATNDIPIFPCLSSSVISTTCSTNLAKDNQQNVFDVACFNTATKSITVTNSDATPSSNQSIQTTNHHQSVVNHNMLNVVKICPESNNYNENSTGAGVNIGHKQTVLEINFPYIFVIVLN